MLVNGNLLVVLIECYGEDGKSVSTAGVVEVDGEFALGDFSADVVAEGDLFIVGFECSR